jgi:hypothetical protein
MFVKRPGFEPYLGSHYTPAPTPIAYLLTAACAARFARIPNIPHVLACRVFSLVGERHRASAHACAPAYCPRAADRSKLQMMTVG